MKIRQSVLLRLLAWVMAMCGIASSVAPQVFALAPRSQVRRIVLETNKQLMPKHLVASCERLESVAKHGILSGKDYEALFGKMPSATWEYDISIGRYSVGSNPHIDFNLLSNDASRDRRRSCISIALFNQYHGSLQVPLERSTDDRLIDSIGGSLLGPSKRLNKIMEERAHASVLYVIDPEKLSTQNRDVVNRRHSSVTKELEAPSPLDWYYLNLVVRITGPAQSNAILAVFVPKDMESLAKEIFPETIVKGVGDASPLTLRIARPEMPEIVTGWGPDNPDHVQADITIRPPAYEEALDEYLQSLPAGKPVLLHGMRLIAPSDMPSQSRTGEETLNDPLPFGISL